MSEEMPEHTNETRLALLAKNEITIESVFVPFSQSRNKGNKTKSLNWVVTLFRRGRKITSFDYTSGWGNAPAAKVAKFKVFGGGMNLDGDAALTREIEIGRAHDTQRPIKPDTLDVVACLVLDCRVLDSGGFENWCDDYGYNSDSIRALDTYRTCLERALQMRHGLGEGLMNDLYAAFSDY